MLSRGEFAPHVALVTVDPGGRLTADRHQPLFVPLADAGEELGIEMQVGGADGDEL